MGGDQQPLAQRPFDWTYLTSLNRKHPYPTELCAKSLQKNVPPLYPDCTWPMMLGPINRDQYGRTGFIQSPQQECEHLMQWDPQEGPTLGRQLQACNILRASETHSPSLKPTPELDLAHAILDPVSLFRSGGLPTLSALEPPWMAKSDECSHVSTGCSSP